mgnify:CR=1 FL=1
MLKTLGAQVKQYRWVTFITPVFSALEAVADMFLPMLMSQIIDKGVKVGGQAGMQAVLHYGAIMVAVAIGALVCGILAGRFASIASTGFAANLRQAMFANIQSFSFSNIDRFSTAGLVTRLTTDVSNVQLSYQMITRICVRAPVMFITALIMAFSIHASLSMIFVAAIVILAATLSFIIFKATGTFNRVFKKYDDLNASVQENVGAIRVVKAYVRGDYESERFRGTAEDLRQATLSSSRLFTLTGPIQMTILWGCTIVLLLLGGREIIFRTTGLLTGELVSLVSYTTQAVNALTMLTWLIMALSRAHASLVRINEVLDETVDITDGPSDAVVEDGSVDFEDVCFSYSGDPDKLALRHITVHINSGETIGIIGGTGEGKSTLVNLIPRFYDTLSGTVRVGGRDVRDYTLEHLRDGVSMVLQNGALFSGTIAQNLRWGNANATQEQLREACAIACADEFIDRFPDGYETVLEQNAANLSGGQKQRLRIARAIVKQPKILILDDSTSAVDMATDEHIRRALKTAMPGSTKIIIAQRIASILSCDRIIVLHEGELSDVGTHAELMERSQIYRDVYDSQMREEGEQHGQS